VWAGAFLSSFQVESLIVRKIQDTQVGSVRMVQSVAFPFFVGDGPSFFSKAAFENFSKILTELEDARNTWTLCR
jgi:hypothetical protein